LNSALTSQYGANLNEDKSSLNSGWKKEKSSHRDSKFFFGEIAKKRPLGFIAAENGRKDVIESLLDKGL